MTQDGTQERPEREPTKRRHVRVAGRRMPIPHSKRARVAVGTALVILGCFGFLPILGFWMIPVGLLVLSHDMPSIRRKRRQFEVWWYRRKQKGTGSNPNRHPGDFSAGK